jgi:hypothetical protein
LGAAISALAGALALSAVLAAAAHAATEDRVACTDPATYGPDSYANGVRMSACIEKVPGKRHTYTAWAVTKAENTSFTSPLDTVWWCEADLTIWLDGTRIQSPVSEQVDPPRPVVYPDDHCKAIAAGTQFSAASDAGIRIFTNSVSRFTDYTINSWDWGLKRSKFYRVP